MILSIQIVFSAGGKSLFGGQQWKDRYFVLKDGLLSYYNIEPALYTSAALVIGKGTSKMVEGREPIKTYSLMHCDIEEVKSVADLIPNDPKPSPTSILNRSV